MINDWLTFVSHHFVCLITVSIITKSHYKLDEITLICKILEDNATAIPVRIKSEHGQNVVQVHK